MRVDVLMMAGRKDMVWSWSPLFKHHLHERDNTSFADRYGVVVSVGVTVYPCTKSWSWSWMVQYKEEMDSE